jgi:hypothetical protein
MTKPTLTPDTLFRWYARRIELLLKACAKTHGIMLRVERHIGRGLMSGSVYAGSEEGRQLASGVDGW